MKTLLLSTLFLISSIALASATTSTDSPLVCYESPRSHYGFIPHAFCFDSASLDSDQEVLYVFGAKSKMPKMLRMTNLSQKNATHVDFTAMATVVDFSFGSCEEVQFAELVIEGTSTNIGEMNSRELSLKVNYSYMPDSCHSKAQTGTVKYNLVK